MKPKPLSVRHRFLLLQTSTFGLAIWFLAGAMYINLRIRTDLAEPLKDLSAVMALDSEFKRLQGQLMIAAAHAYWHPDKAAREALSLAGRQSEELRKQYANLPLSSDERRSLDRLGTLLTRLIEDTARSQVADPRSPEALTRFKAMSETHVQIVALRESIARAHLERVQASTAKLWEYTRMLYLLLTAFGLFAVLVLQQFRRVHQREIWRPLKELRRMVAEVRRGNLDLSGAVPHSVEFGPLVKGFLEMAGELRQMRDGLERKVEERTAKLEAAQKELLQAEKLSSLGQLVSGVAHEFNNPLTSILGFSEVGLARKELDPRLRNQLETIRGEALRLKNVVANLCSFARRAPQRMARLDLRRVLDQVADLRRYQLTVSNVQLHCERPSKPVWVQGNIDQLTQVFFNLVLNSEQAIKACRQQGDIWLACGEEAGHAWATVRDNGTGMSPATRARIFDPFFTTKPPGQGTGLGLSITYGIIDQHQGRISVESSEGEGTTIRILLPVGEAAVQPPPSPQPAARNTGPGDQHHALIVDDERGIAGLIEHYLKNRGWTCVILNDSAALESHLAGQTFDVVICDLKMPGRSGLDVLRLLRAQRPELARRFVLITGDLADEAQRQAVELASVPVLYKPFTLAHLAEVLESVVSGPDPLPIT